MTSVDGSVERAFELVRTALVNPVRSTLESNWFIYQTSCCLDG
jgi:hypothetical protein